MNELEALQRENAELRRQTLALTAQLGELITELARLNERVSELLAVAQRKHRKPAVEKPPAAPPTIEGDARRAFDERPTAPEKAPEAPQAKAKTKPSGRKPIPSHLEAEEHELRASACACCGKTGLDVVDELIEEKLHVVKEHQRRRVVRRFTSRCRACGERTTPRSLPAPYERSKVTCEWLAWLVYQKFWLLTPLDRIRRDLAERGVPVAMSTLVTLIERASELLSGVDGLHWKQLLASPWMATDGTGLKVLVPKLPVAHNGYVELYRGVSEEIFDAYAECLGHLGEDVGTGWLVAELPEGDGLLLDADSVGELGLAEPCGTTEGGDASALLWTRLGEGTTHTPRIGAGLGRKVVGHRFALAQ